MQVIRGTCVLALAVLVCGSAWGQERTADVEGQKLAQSIRSANESFFASTTAEQRLAQATPSASASPNETASSAHPATRLEEMTVTDRALHKPRRPKRFALVTLSCDRIPRRKKFSITFPV